MREKQALIPGLWPQEHPKSACERKAMKYFRLLTIAGSDSGGGAGIQADLKTFSALGCYGMSVICALTAQNTQAVTGIYPISPEFISLQIDAIMDDIGVDAVKIGMLHSPEVIIAVTERLKHYRAPNIVVDPVMVSTGGDKLLQDDAVDALKTILFPIADVITPNLPEAAMLLNLPVEALIGADSSRLEAACKELSAFGAQAVVLKGGHATSRRILDLLYTAKDDRLKQFESTRIDTRNTHGTGCTLSAAIAAHLAKGHPLEDAVLLAKTYITMALEAGAAYQIGTGHGPVHHFHKYWK
jgi:hydroxymethylpyrimidine/phosphomethylpyrimidine kinase